MAVCVTCGKHGIFLRLDSNGLCKQCAKEAERREREEYQEAFKREREQKDSEPLPAEHPLQKSKSPILENRILGYSHVATAQINLQRIHDRGAELDFAYHDPDEEDIDIPSPHTVVTANPVGNIGAVHEYVVLDFETTGLSCEKDQIIEIGAIKISGDVEVDSMSTFVNPGVPIPAEITQLTGISNDNVANAPNILIAISALHEFINGLPLIAHNASFDVGFLCAAYKKANISEEINYIDTLHLARKAFPNAPNHKLATLITYLPLGSRQDHRALSDVRFTNSLYKKCLTNLKGKNSHIETTSNKILSKEQLKFAEWAKKTLIDANRDTSLLAFEVMSKYFRISCYFCVLDIKLGGKLQYVLVEYKYQDIFDDGSLLPCPSSEGPSCDGYQSKRFPINPSTDLNELTPLLLAAFDSAHANYQSIKKFLTQRDLDIYHSKSVKI